MAARSSLPCPMQETMTTTSDFDPQAFNPTFDSLFSERIFLFFGYFGRFILLVG